MFQIIRQQYIGQLVESFKQSYRDKHGKEPSKQYVQVFIEFLDKETKLIDKMVEMAFQESIEFIKEATPKDEVAATESKQPSKKKGNIFVEKFREIIVAPIVIGGLIFALTSGELVFAGIFALTAIVLALLWWRGK
ncbi:hypothetical protein [uncultured Brevibacillus sp.]|uniref:hypothetical protein n=1 Tax=uncultured Brevibacillus sp. TaxID=169970 RepID=UPI002598DC1B|nr:hypothetical protein [uncultured Brevibacillus sp.]